MLVRDLEPGDEPGVHTLLEAAFDGPAVAALWRDVRARGHVRRELVAVDDDAPGVLGHVGLSHGWLDTRERLLDVWVLSPLSTRPDRQGHGVGSRLLEAALRAQAEAGVPALFLEGSPDYYGSRGFARASGLGFEPPTRRIPDAAFQVALGETHEPWMTGRLVYRDVWWEHDSTGLRDPLLAELEERLGPS